jgi:DNA-binding CsgD family transcriptional regulator
MRTHAEVLAGLVPAPRGPGGKHAKPSSPPEPDFDYERPLLIDIGRAAVIAEALRECGYPRCTADTVLMELARPQRERSIIGRFAADQLARAGWRPWARQPNRSSYRGYRSQTRCGPVPRFATFRHHRGTHLCRGVCGPRQQEVLALLADGLPDREISRRLFISERTVHHHVSAVLSKIGVPTRVAAAREAARTGIAAPS